MKYFEDDKLTKLTSELTDVTLGRSRSIHGRIEAYTMKRAGTDKKYAHALGERYVAEMETVESQLAEYKNFLERCSKFPSIMDNSNSNSGDSPSKRKGRKRSSSTGTQLEATRPTKQPKKTKSRRRSSSFDESGLRNAKTAAAAGAAGGVAHSNTSTENSNNNTKTTTTNANKSSAAAALGNFGEMGTRRLMTDLILTLNSSFPDYDFGSVRPTDFEKIPVASAMPRINERLSELAVDKASLLADMWQAMDGVVRLVDCEVYSYAPKTRDEDDDPLSFLTQTLIGDHNESDGSGDGMHLQAAGESSSQSTGASSSTVLWSFNYFFVNKLQKRIVYFTCVESMRSEETNHNLLQQDVADYDEEVEFVRYQHGTMEASDVDFDLDPSGNIAGGFPISTV